jgi:hypothetical protein
MANQSSGGIGIGGALLILFIALKLTGHIGWSWYWVLSPLTIPFTIIFGIIAFIIAMGLVFLSILGFVFLFFAVKGAIHNGSHLRAL